MPSDKRYVAASQVAYMNLDKYFQVAKENNIKNPSFTIGDIAGLLSDHDRKIYEYIKSKLASDIDSWKIVDVYDKNDKNGFACCVMETPEGNAMVGFRGSESMASLMNGIHDWTEADIMLINETCTKQQGEVRAFLKSRQKLLNKYDNLYFTGHSLGGNLAEYAAIVSEEYGLDDNLKKCVSLDGPGFSGEFLEKYKQQINKIKDKMKHYRWSFVGTMLNDLPGVEYQFVKVVENDSKAYCFTRHDTRNLDFEGDSLQEGAEQDTLSKITQKVSQGVDHMPEIAGNIIKVVASGAMIFACACLDIIMNENEEITATGLIKMAGIVAVLAKIGLLVPILKVVLAIVAFIVVAAVVAFVYEYIYEAVTKLIQDIVNFACECISKITDWAKEKIEKYKKDVIELVNKVQKWYNSNFNTGYIYAQSNLEILLDTRIMSNYLNRLNDINKKLVDIDQRMDTLYSGLKLFDKGRLMSADFKTHGSFLLLRCCAYLGETINDFEAVEGSIVGAM